MGKHWIVYYLIEGAACAVRAFASEGAAHADAAERAANNNRQYFIAELVGVTSKVVKPTYEIKRV